MSRVEVPLCRRCNRRPSIVGETKDMNGDWVYYVTCHGITKRCAVTYKELLSMPLGTYRLNLGPDFEPEPKLNPNRKPKWTWTKDDSKDED